MNRRDFFKLIGALALTPATKLLPAETLHVVTEAKEFGPAIASSATFYLGINAANNYAMMHSDAYAKLIEEGLL